MNAILRVWYRFKNRGYNRRSNARYIAARAHWVSITEEERAAHIKYMEDLNEAIGIMARNAKTAGEIGKIFGLRPVQQEVVE